MYKKNKGLVGGALGTLAFKGWAEEEQPSKGPRAGTGNERQGGKMADPGNSRSGGPLPRECTKQRGLLYTQILGSHPASLRQ